MLLKQVEAGGLFAWSNSKKYSNFFATGTLFDASQNQNEITQDSFLNIYSLDIHEKSEFANCIGKTKSESLFTSLAWDTFGEQSTYPCGIIVGGMADGYITIWDPNVIISYWKTNQNVQELEVGIGCLHQEQLYSSAVNCIEFNPFKSNLIACGGGNEVLILDIQQNISEPNLFNPGSPNYHEKSTVSCVSWNKKVNHILASGSQDGIIVVWDLKTNQAIFDLQIGGQCSQNQSISLSWNPEIPTQIAVSTDDERTTELQIWDLRNHKGPVMVFDQGHSKSINYVDWCTYDPSLILTSGKDQKVICWNYKNGEIINGIETDESVMMAKWSPIIPSIFGVASESGRVSINRLNDEIEGHVPKWSQTPVGATFGPNGKLIVFKEELGVVVNAYEVSQFEEQVEEQLDLLEKIITVQNAENLDKICAEIEIKQQENSDDLKQWNFLKAQCQQNSEEILNVLGLNKKEIIKEAEKYTGKTHQSQIKEKENDSSKPQLNKPLFANMTENDACDFFEQAAQTAKQQREKKQVTAAPESSQNIDKKLSAQDQEMQEFEQVSKNINWDAGVEKIIKKNLLIGNFEGAIDCSLKCGRVAEALLLAYSTSEMLFDSTAKAFFVSSKDLFIKNVFKNIYEKQTQEIVNTYDLNKWKEVVAMCLSNNTQEEFEELMDVLAERFIKEKKDTNNAILCYILSMNIEKIILIFTKNLEKYSQRTLQRKLMVIRSVQKLLIIQKQIMENTQALEGLLIECSNIALEFGKPLLGFKLLAFFTDDKNQEVLIAKDFIYQSNEAIMIENKISQPIIPYKVSQIKPSPNVIKNQQQQHQQQQQLQQQQVQGGQKMMPNQQFGQQMPNQQINNKGPQTLQNQQQQVHQQTSQLQQQNKFQQKPQIQQQKQMIPPMKGPHQPQQQLQQQQQQQNLNQPPTQQQQQQQQQQPFGQQIQQQQQQNKPQIMNPNQMIAQQQQQQNTMQPIPQPQKKIGPPPVIHQQQQQQQLQQQGVQQTPQFQKQAQPQQQIMSPKVQPPVPVHKQQQQQQVAEIQSPNQFSQQQMITQSSQKQFQQPPPPIKQQTPLIQQQQIDQQSIIQQQSQISHQAQSLTKPPPMRSIPQQKTQSSQQTFHPPMGMGGQQQPKMQQPQQQFSNQKMSNSNSNTDFFNNNQPQQNQSDAVQYSSQEYQFINNIIQQQISNLPMIEQNQRQRQQLEKGLQSIFQSLEAGNMSLNTFENLFNLCQEMESGDFNSAFNTHKKIWQSDFEKNKSWLQPMKKVIQSQQK